MCAKQLWKNAISSKDAGHWLESLLKISYLHRYFSLFHTFCNQLPDFFVTRTLAANGLKPNIFNKNFAKLSQEKTLFPNFLRFPGFPGLSQPCMHMPYLQHRFQINVLLKKFRWKRERQREVLFGLINAVNGLGRYVPFYP